MPMNNQSPWGKKKKPGTPEDFLAALIVNRDYIRYRLGRK